MARLLEENCSIDGEQDRDLATATVIMTRRLPARCKSSPQSPDRNTEIGGTQLHDAEAIAIKATCTGWQPRFSPLPRHRTLRLLSLTAALLTHENSITAGSEPASNRTQRIFFWVHGSAAAGPVTA